MTEENVTPPKQTEFTITLPDRETQYQKTPAKITVTNITTTSSQTSIIYPDGTQTDEDVVQSDPVETELEVPATQEVDDGQGNITKQPMTLGALLEAANAEQPVSGISGVSLKQSTSQLSKGGAIMLGGSSKPAPSITANLLPIKGIAEAEDVEQAIKEKGIWGLGCPANCGAFKEFIYNDIVPQTYVCPVCGVTIHLVNSQ